MVLIHYHLDLIHLLVDERVSLNSSKKTLYESVWQYIEKKKRIIYI
jgi:hypothetical protein